MTGFAQVRRRVAGGAVMVMTVGAVACGGAGGGDGAGPEVSDSSGVRLVVNRVPAAGFGAAAVVEPTPVWSADVAGPGAVAEVVAAVTLPDGTVAVADAAAGRVLFLSADGAALLAEVDVVPGGVGRLGRMGKAGGDTLWVADHYTGRLHWLTAAGVLGKEAFPPGLVVAGRFADDSYLVVPLPLAEEAGAGLVEGVRRDTVAWARWAPRRSVVEPVGRFLQDELVVVLWEDGPVTAAPPFGRRTSRAVGPEGFWAGDQTTFEIRYFSREGRLRQILRLDGLDLTLTEELKASVRPVAEPGAPTLVDRLWEGVPPKRPAYTRLLLDDAGRLWVAEHVAGAAPPRDWLLFSAEGAALGLVTVPPGFTLQEVGSDSLLGVEGGATGGRVVRYPLTFPPRG